MRLGARLWWGLVPLTVLLWGVGALTPVVFPGLPVPPVAVLAAIPGLAFARDIAIAMVIGCLVTMLLIDPDPPARRRLRRWAWGWGAIGLGLIAAGGAALRTEVAAGAAPGGDLVDSLAGRALIVQFACLIIAVVLAGVGPRALRWFVLAIGLIGAAVPVLGGHAGLAGEHAAAGGSIALHVMAVSLWVGGLAVVVGMLALDAGPAAELLPRFSALALGCVIVLAESGLLTASLTAGSIDAMVGSDYGSIVLAKAALLLVLVRLGWLQRRRVVDRIADPGPRTNPLAVVDLARFTGVELLVMGAAVAGSVVLARIGPPPAGPGQAVGFTALALIALGTIAPMAIAAMRPARWRVVAALPEVPVIVLVILIAETGGVGPLRQLAGAVGVLVEAALLVLVGWLAASAMRRSRTALLIGAAGIPVAVVVATWLADLPRPMAVVAVLAAVAAAIAWGWSAPERTATRAADRDIASVTA